MTTNDSSFKKWTGSAAIVTGGASGLGAATARLLASLGLQVVVWDRDKTAGERIASDIGGMFVGVDVADASSVQGALAIVKEQVGDVRVLVNCAGIGRAAKTVSRGEAHDPALFTSIVNVNLNGTFHCASQVAAAMLSAEPLDTDGTRGVIVNTASVAAYDGQVGQIAYAASKGGIVSMTLPMARDLADKGIRVCAIAPGLFETPLLKDLPDEARESIAGQIPFPCRLGDPAEFATLVAHIINNSMLNGEVIRLDGAVRMAPR